MGMSPQRRFRNWGDIVTMYLRSAADARSGGTYGRTTDAVSLPPKRQRRCRSCVLSPIPPNPVDIRVLPTIRSV